MKLSKIEKSGFIKDASYTKMIGLLKDFQGLTDEIKDSRYLLGPDLRHLYVSAQVYLTVHLNHNAEIGEQGLKEVEKLYSGVKKMISSRPKDNKEQLELGMLILK